MESSRRQRTALDGGQAALAAARSASQVGRSLVERALRIDARDTYLAGIPHEKLTVTVITDITHHR